ncbi:PurM C-terminal domain-like protein [Neocallimastix lanati (nom. inval.)]|uniref:PurM C-terminal domain-like protein n=1 Tax=Neocallimastix californiae TaxID=1754190 RepID=A0A1Y2E326_9FUNG|nr:PurM C-terminal domain-like protein [Neocallimastix sp. JGI-2020a]ORY65716.1 PurM C-terminal domain-like protein [Neocallimastix californiae]|eukprot:ORY65716.1 PurM C-terminal domain-like protein [Neocallimastix californiae]
MILQMILTNLFQVLLAAAESRLDVGFSDCFATTIVAASKGYPEKYQKVLEIIIDTMLEDVTVFHAGTKIDNSKLVTSGSRVLTVTSVTPTLQETLTTKPTKNPILVLYVSGEYDVAGFCIGIVESENLLPHVNDIKIDDVILGLASSGIHSNGFSLVHLIIEKDKFNYNAPSPFAENQNLVLPKNVIACIDASSYSPTPVFKWLKKNGNIENLEFAGAFNYGIGTVIICDAAKANEFIASVNAFDILDILDIIKNI